MVSLDGKEGNDEDQLNFTDITSGGAYVLITYFLVINKNSKGLDSGHCILQLVLVTLTKSG